MMQQCCTLEHALRIISAGTPTFATLVLTAKLNAAIYKPMQWSVINLDQF